MFESKIYTPECMSRRGEFTAWALTVLAVIGLFFLSQRGPLPFWAWFFVLFLAFSAMSVSLGNWMDRRTRLQLQADGVAFENGLRQTHLTWNEIREVRVAPARWGSSVQVIGERAHFSFATLGEMRFQKQSIGSVGFAEGGLILDEIVRSAGLAKVSKNGDFCTYSRP
jgi:hypothetical protein